ncbi:MAG: hypothetical protein RI101_10755 [Nitrospira sp.]|nr:hypothetical protein [Nitrospira sp.]
MPGPIIPQTAISPPLLHHTGSLFLGFFWLAAILLSAQTGQAEIRIVTAQGEYRMGNRDTREDAIRLATEQAKRNALEQVATYLESITVVDGLDITKDEIRTYTAGLVLVLDQQTMTTLDDNVVVKTDLVAQIDTEEVSQAIAALRDNEDARHQLVALKQENEQLQQELDAANRALATASTADQAQQATQQRQEILNRVQSNAMVSQAWTDWVLVSPVVSPYPWIGLAQTHALLNVARGLYPASPHVTIAQQVFTSKQPPMPPQPPVPPAPGLSQPAMPSHQIVPPPGSPGGPRTLNEIVQTVPTVPPQTGQQSSGHIASRTQPSPRQNYSREQPGIYGYQPPQPGSYPPGTHRLPPTINQIHPPLPHQVPRVPYHVAPRSSGGGGSHGGGGGHNGNSGGRRGRP